MNLKEQAARRALGYVRSGMVLGLGTGSTTAFLIDMLGQQLGTGTLRDIVAVPTSEGTASRARAAGIPLSTLAKYGRLDLALDGADEVDPQLNLLKGLGRGLLREKIVAVHADRFVVMVEDSKLVPTLGTRAPLPMEIVPFGAEAQVRWLNTLGCRAEFRLETDGTCAVTDNGNYLAHCWFAEGIANPHGLARTLADRPGIVEHGLFLDLASTVVVAGAQGIRVLERAVSDS